MFANRIINVAILAICVAWAAHSLGYHVWPLGSQATRQATYDVPLGEAHRLLAQMTLPPFVFSNPQIELKTEAQVQNKVDFLIMDNGSETMRFIADLTAASDRSTRVALTLKGTTNGAFGNVDERLTANPTLRALYVASMNEQVAATLEHRDYKISVTYPALGAAMAANIKNISAQMDAAAAAWKQRDHDAIAKAYADEAAGRLQSPYR